jgi:hypothetical protein
VASASVATGPTVITPTSSAPFALTEGIYRVTWKTTGCTSITAVLQGDNGITKEKTSSIPNFSFIATGVEDGTYTLNQTDPSCAQWELEIEKIGG